MSEESMSMVERVARVLASSWEGDAFERDPERWRQDARAAIAVMREPSSGMVRDGLIATNGCVDLQASRDGWRAMIDAALAS